MVTPTTLQYPVQRMRLRMTSLLVTFFLAGCSVTKNDDDDDGEWDDNKGDEWGGNAIHDESSDPVDERCHHEDDTAVTESDEPALNGRWYISWSAEGARIDTSCAVGNLPDEDYFNRALRTLQIEVSTDGSALLDFGQFPEELPCNGVDGTHNTDSCLDEDPYSTSMDGVRLSETEFVVEKVYGGMQSESYVRWSFEVDGSLDDDQINGEAIMKLQHCETPECDMECRTMVTETYSAISGSFGE